MKMNRYVLISLFLVFLVGCKSESNGFKYEQPALNPDIRLSGWYKSEEHDKDIIDVMNFGDVEAKVNVTTICFDGHDKIIPSNDSEVLIIPPMKKWTWIPECPKGTASYTIGLKEES